jgi:dinuclear metal center YbgI/SA1388 family protein
MFRATVRQAFKMTDATSRSAPFSRAVFQAIRKLYPESLADKSWDNTGLLLEAPFDPLRRQINSVLLTVDLTRAVADEAIERKDSVVIAYHPIIFKGLKSLTLGDTQQASLLRLVAEGISVYSPHTALDSAPGGINDWLADIVTGTPTSTTKEDQKSTPSSTSTNAGDLEQQPPSLKRPVFLLAHHPSAASLGENAMFKLNSIKHERKPITPLESESHPGAGQGRLVHFAKPQSLSSLIERIAKGLGNPKGFPIAIPQNKTIDQIDIRSVGICAGSGGGLLSPLRNVDLLFTGELSHHEALAAIERGQVVIALFHSNTERGFLHGVLRAQLEEQIREEWEELRKSERESVNSQDDETIEALMDKYVNVQVSERDRDPYGIVIGTSEVE